MILSITSLRLQSPFKIFKVYKYSYRVMKQIKKSPCLAVRTTGSWSKHYTMTLWRNEEEKLEFYKSGAHLDAMKNASRIAKEIASLNLEADSFLGWKDAKMKLEEQGKKYTLRGRT
ncbi:DUF3291 domain-containing protein [Eudoraea chungangensis]|uniref:DUF3291 domain-containing protein n=1 Tax=Eudoraea chungangensis TaxID=1481905 RepID=UPI0023EBFE81|nr:DUF3291 domain-containing protein [Eudoraea chungangensis]